MVRGIALGLLLALGTAAAAARQESLQDVTVSGRLRAMADVRRATRLDALIATATVLKGRKVPQDFGDAVSWLKKRGYAEPEEIVRLDSPATKGFASLLMMRALDMEGGALHRLTGSERTAYLHLKYLRMVPPGGAGAPITGPELLSLTNLARAWHARKNKREVRR